MKSRRPKPVVPERKARAVDSRAEAKQLILDLVSASEGQVAGKTRLFKVFYAAHLFYARNCHRALTRHPIARMPRGPGIDGGTELLNELQVEGKLRITRVPIDSSGQSEYQFELVGEVGPVDPERAKAIELAIQWAKSKSAYELSRETHEKSRSWREGEDGDELDVFADMLKEAEFRARESTIDKVESLFEDAFGESS